MTGSTSNFIEGVAVKHLRARLERLLLQELQTGGGLALVDLVDSQGYSSRTRIIVAEIHELVSRLQQLRSGMIERVANLLVRRFAPRCLLDIGAGLAPWSLAVLAQSQLVTATAFDLPTCSEDLVKEIERAGQDKRMFIAVGDVFETDFTTFAPQDLVLVANVCHLFDAARVQTLFDRVSCALCSGGTIAVIDQILDDHPNWRQRAALYAVGASLWLPGGHLHTFSEYTRFLQNSGFRNISYEPICAPPEMTLITARR